MIKAPKEDKTKQSDNALAIEAPADRAPKEQAASLLAPSIYTQLESAAILSLIFIFIGLFAWLSYRPDQRIFEYYVFAGLMTLICSGLLKAVGRYQKAGLALGGSIVIFGAIFWITHDQFDKDTKSAEIIAKLRTDGVHLQKILNGEIEIYTKATDNRALTNVLIEYTSAETGQQRIARNLGGIHYLPLKDLIAAGSGIRVILDPSNTPAERLVKSTDVQIDWFTYRTDPLQLQLFLLTK